MRKKEIFFFIIKNTKNKIGYIRLSKLNRANLLLSIAIIEKFKKKE